MGSSGWIILGIIILAVVVVFYNQAQEVATGIIQLGQATTASNSLQINPTSGQSVCDLKIVFTPNLIAQALIANPSQSDNGAFISPIAAWDMQSGARTVSWQNCHQYANPFTMSFIPLSWAGSFPIATGPPVVSANDILLSGGQTVHFNLSVVSPNGNQRSYTTDPLCIQFCTAVSIPSGTVYVPKQYTFTFVITNLPKQPYRVLVTSDIPINGQVAGTPYIQNVS